MALTAEEIAQRARQAFERSSQALAVSSSADEKRSSALLAICQALEANKDAIRKANEQDMVEARTLVAQGKLTAALASRLDLFSKPGKWESMLQGVSDVARLPSPLDKVTWAKRLAEPSETQGPIDLWRVTCPIGVLLCIFEARPEVVVNIASLAIKSGNAAILKGGKESRHTAAHLSRVIAQALAHAGLEEGLIQTVETRADIQSLLHLDDYIDLVIPRGSNELVKAIQRDARMPVMGHADGLCIGYVHSDAPLSLTIGTVKDAKMDYPAACNALETLLVHQDHLHSGFWDTLARQLLEAGVELRCDQALLSALSAETKAGAPSTQLVLAQEADYDTEFLDLILAVKSVSDLDTAISHISTHSSGHTDMILTAPNTPNRTADKFVRSLNSANVFVNISSRFADGFRYGLGTEVGISTGKTHARGPVGLDGLVIYKYIANGSQAGKHGPQTAAQFTAERTFTHSDLPLPSFPSL